MIKIYFSPKITQVGSPILLRTAQITMDFTDPSRQDLIESLMTTMMKSNRIKIAVFYVFQSLRLFIIASYSNPRHYNAPVMNSIKKIGKSVPVFRRYKDGSSLSSNHVRIL
jgi:peptide deformylase